MKHFRQVKDKHCQALGVSLTGASEQLGLSTEEDTTNANEDFQVLFDGGETVVAAYECTLDLGMRWLGKMYITPSSICFHSVTYGKKREMRIRAPISDVREIVRHRTIFNVSARAPPSLPDREPPSWWALRGPLQSHRTTAKSSEHDPCAHEACR